MWKIKLEGDTLPLASGRQKTISPPSHTLKTLNTSTKKTPRRTKKKEKKNQTQSDADCSVNNTQDPEPEPTEEMAGESVEPCPAKECELMNFSVDMWSESRVATWLTNNCAPLPPLTKITEMHVRIKASHKFMCTFLNNAGQECSVWVSDILLFHHYQDRYMQAKEDFLQAVQR